MLPTFLLCSLFACAPSEPETTVCEQAEAVVAECGSGGDVDFGECGGEVEDAAQTIVDSGCAAVAESRDLQAQGIDGGLRVHRVTGYTP